MQTRVITLRFNGLQDAFDDEPLRDFTKDKEVISVRDHFFVRNDQPYLAVVVNYTLKPMATEAVAKSGQQSKRREENWRQYVAEADLPLFNTLRDWRLERSKQDGVPPYVICTNRQLAAIVAARAQTLAKLGEVEGFGKAKLERYGADVLAVLTPKQTELPAPTAQPKPADQTEI
ncbi:MAG: HRDC domain-containing protein [Blastocatellia bacterium]